MPHQWQLCFTYKTQQQQPDSIRRFHQLTTASKRQDREMKTCVYLGIVLAFAVSALATPSRHARGESTHKHNRQTISFPFINEIVTKVPNILYTSPIPQQQITTQRIIAVLRLFQHLEDNHTQS